MNRASFYFLKNKFPRLYQLCIYLIHKYRSYTQYREGKLFQYQFTGLSSMLSGDFEKEETTLVSALLEDADLFIDIGANTGYYVAIASHKNIKTIAIEPLKQNLKILNKNIKANNWSDVEVIPVALGSKLQDLKIFGSDTGASFVNNWAGNDQTISHTIPVVTLDSIIADRSLEDRILVKIDAEGYEYEILKGARNFLSRYPKPVLLIEICFNENFPSGQNPDFHDTFKYLWNLGYKIYTADTEMHEVMSTDLERWMNTGVRDFGNANYLIK